MQHRSRSFRRPVASGAILALGLWALALMPAHGQGRGAGPAQNPATQTGPAPVRAQANAQAKSQVQAKSQAQIQAPSPAQAPPARAAAAVTPAAPPATAPALSRYEAELDGIRRALLASTLENAPTRVVSTAWIDEHGRLHESAQFASEARVRGVRVLSYLREPADPAAPPPVEVTAEALPVGLGPAAADPAACARAGQRWRQPLQLAALQPPQAPHPQGHVGQAVMALAGQAWLEAMQSSQRWHVQVPPPSPPASTYERALLGSRDGPAGWQAHLALVTRPPAPAGAWQRVLAAAPPQDLAFELRLILSNPLDGRALWQAAVPVTVSEAQRSAGPGHWMQAIAQELRPRMAAWQAELDRISACEPVQFELASDRDLWQLQAGAAHGLRAGDRLLILDRRHLPRRVLEPGAAHHLALAEVAQVGPQSARLRQLAGPALAGRGDWVALPF